MPGLLEERVYLLIRSLPKSQRQACSPARDVAIAFLEEWHGWVPTRDLFTELAAFLTKRTGHIIDTGMFDESRLPDGYRAKVRIWSDEDEELAFGTDIAELRHHLRQIPG